MITVRDLSWQYEPLVDGGKPVDSLKHVSFDIKSGSFVGVIGPTGAGKSTLFNAITGGFIADEGSITLGGEDITFAPA